MKNYLLQLRIFSLFLLLLAVAFSACKKSYTGMVEDDSLNRSFSPSNLRISTVRDSAKFSWNTPLYISGKDVYLLELSTDSSFTSIDYSQVADSTAAFVLDTSIRLNVNYFSRVRVQENTAAHKAASTYCYNTKSFRLLGQQYIKIIRDFEVSTDAVLLHWYVLPETAGLTHLVLSSDGTDSVRYNIDAAEVTMGQKTINGLQPNKRYTVQLLAGNKSKGIATFKTNAAVVYTRILSPSDNLGDAIATASHNDVIGLNPGTYNLSAITYIEQKKISLVAVSRDPLNTKILCREINLAGDSAGIVLSGIEVNGNYSGSSFGAQFIQLQGSKAVTNVDATFKEIRLDNCIVHDFTRCLIRGNYGAAANAHKINSITVNNCRIYNIDAATSSGYYTFTIEKLQVNAIEVTNSTLYKNGTGLMNMSTNLNAATGIVPAIKIDHCTLNYFSGGSARYAFFDANANKIVFNFNNSIVANTPISGSLNAAAFRATNTGSELSFSNNNYFRLLIAPGGAALNLTGLAQANDISVDLGWGASTTDFSLAALPAAHPVLTASSTGSAVGDPRWAY